MNKNMVESARPLWRNRRGPRRKGKTVSSIQMDLLLFVKVLVCQKEYLGYVASVDSWAAISPSALVGHS